MLKKPYTFKRRPGFFGNILNLWDIYYQDNRIGHRSFKVEDVVIIVYLLNEAYKLGQQDISNECP
jgi:hypothetical protein